MNNICLKYDNGSKFNVSVVRYFNFENNKYLIYSLKEYDEREYEKLYVVKIMRELNTLIAQTVRKPSEWKQMKNILKYILVEIKNNQIKSIEDLNYLELDGITLYGYRSFWMASDLVEMLTIKSITNNSETTENSNEKSLSIKEDLNSTTNIPPKQYKEEELEVLEL